eukprot:2626855-Pyramimonas_sp.AAC.1
MTHMLRCPLITAIHPADPHVGWHRSLVTLPVQPRSSMTSIARVPAPSATAAATSRTHLGIGGAIKVNASKNSNHLTFNAGRRPRVLAVLYTFESVFGRYSHACSGQVVFPTACLGRKSRDGYLSCPLSAVVAASLLARKAWRWRISWRT